MFSCRRAVVLLILMLFFLTTATPANDWYYFAVGIADDQIGDQYTFGDEGPDTFDCTGLTQYAYRHVGVELPRVSGDQAVVGQPVDGELQPGDLIFFDATKIRSGDVNHAGIYAGNGKFIQANAPGYGVESTTLNSDEHFWSGVTWEERIVAKRRLTPPPGPSTKFAKGDVVLATEDGVSIRDAALNWMVIDKTSADSIGSIRSLPMLFNGYWYWEIDFEKGLDGWIAEDYLKKAIGTVSMFAFEGTIESVTDPANVLNGTGISADTSTFTGYFAYDPSTEASSEFLDYTWYPATLLSISIDNTYYATTVNPMVSVTNVVYVDELSVFDWLSTPEHNFPEIPNDFFVRFVDNSGSVFLDRSLPTTLNISDFDRSEIYMHGDNFSIHGLVESIEKVE